MTGYAGSRDYVENLFYPWRTPHWSQHPTGKDDPDPAVADSVPLVGSSVYRKPAQDSQQEGRSLPRQDRDHIFQWDVGISVGVFTETTGSLRNPETRRTPPYEQLRRVLGWGGEMYQMDIKPDKKNPFILFVICNTVLCRVGNIANIALRTTAMYHTAVMILV